MSTLWNAFERWLSNQRDREFIQQMNAVAESDVGFARSELKHFLSNRNDTRERLLTMAEKFGVSPEQIDAERWRAVKLTQACGQCSQEKMCKRFLDKDGDAEGADAFCPNASEYRQMADDAG